MCPNINMPLKCHMCLLFYVQISDNYFSIYIFHMNSLQSTIWPRELVYIHFTLLAYAPKQVCLPHCICMSHCIASVVYITIEPQWCNGRVLGSCVRGVVGSRLTRVKTEVAWVEHSLASNWQGFTPLRCKWVLVMPWH